jgi:hypothetical protein
MTTLERFKAIEAAALKEAYEAFRATEDAAAPLNAMRTSILTPEGVDECAERFGLLKRVALALDASRDQRFAQWLKNQDQTDNDQVAADDAWEFSLWAFVNGWRESWLKREQDIENPRYGDDVRRQLEEDRVHARAFVTRFAKDISAAQTPAANEDIARRLFDLAFAPSGPTSVQFQEAAKKNPILQQVEREYAAAETRLAEQRSPENERELWDALGACAVFRIYAFHWPEVLAAWERERPLPDTFKNPLLPPSFRRVVGGRRHGKAVGFPVSPGVRGLVEIEIPTKGKPSSTLDLSLAIKTRARLRPSDYDEDGELKGDAVIRAVHEVTGPNVSRMLPLVFALAERANEEDETMNGSFWWSPTLGADSLGYARESNGKASHDRISRTGTAQVRADFETFAGISIRHKGDYGQEFVGAFISPLNATLTLEDVRRRPEQRGRDKRTMWQILPQLWAWSRRHYIATPYALLNAGESRPDVWAKCIRLYESLSGYARLNPQSAKAGELKRGLAGLADECNLWPEGRRVSKAADLMAWAQKLEARGFIEGARTANLADGTPALAWSLPAARQSELARVSQAANEKLSARNNKTKARTGD